MKLRIFVTLGCTACRCDPSDRMIAYCIFERLVQAWDLSLASLVNYKKNEPNSSHAFTVMVL